VAALPAASVTVTLAVPGLAVAGMAKLAATLPSTPVVTLAITAVAVLAESVNTTPPPAGCEAANPVPLTTTVAPALAVAGVTVTVAPVMVKIAVPVPAQFVIAILLGPALAVAGGINLMVHEPVGATLRSLTMVYLATPKAASLATKVRATPWKVTPPADIAAAVKPEPDTVTLVVTSPSAGLAVADGRRVKVFVEAEEVPAPSTTPMLPADIAALAFTVAEMVPVAVATTDPTMGSPAL